MQTGFLKNIADRLKRHRRLFLIAIAGAFAAAAFFGWTNFVVWRCGDVVYDQIDQVPARRVGLLLGTGPRLGDGRRNLYFDYRIEAAAALYRAGKIERILASGDNGREEYNEPEAMRDALIAAGVKPEHIVLDYAGFRTLDSVVRAQKVFGAEAFTVISQGFHCKRAVYLARAYGIDAIGYAARDIGNRSARAKMLLRESRARCAAWLDVHILDRSPRFLGEKVPIP